MDFTLVRNISYVIIAITSACAALKFYKTSNGKVRKLLIYDQVSMAIFFTFAIVRALFDAFGMERVGNTMFIPIGINLAVSSFLLFLFIGRK